MPCVGRTGSHQVPVMNSVGVEGRLGRRRLERRLQPPRRRRRALPAGALGAAALVCVVFGCFFAIGRASHTTSSARSEALSQLPVAASGAAAQIRLTSSPAIELRGPIRIQPKRQPAPAPAAPAAATQPARSEPLRTAAPSVPAPSAPAPAPTVTPAPTPAPARSAPAPSGGGSHSSGSSPSFESSG
jgi:hypothetical protein